MFQAGEQASDATASVHPSILSCRRQPCQPPGRRFETQPRSAHPASAHVFTGSPLRPASSPGLAHFSSPTSGPHLHTHTHTHQHSAPPLTVACVAHASVPVICGLVHVCSQMSKPPRPLRPAPLTRTRGKGTSSPVPPGLQPRRGSERCSSLRCGADRVATKAAFP